MFDRRPEVMTSFNDADCSDAIRIVSFVGEKLRDPATALDLVDRACQLPEFGPKSVWPLNLAGGCSGYALLMGALNEAQPECGWGPAASAHLRAATAFSKGHFSLFTGWAGLLVATLYVDKTQNSYVNLRKTILDYIVPRAHRIAGARNVYVNGTNAFEFILGLAGVYVALNYAGNSEANAPFLDYFDWLTAAEDESSWQVLEATAPEPNHPAKNYGLSHGITGVLAALVLGPPSERAAEIANRIANSIINAAFDDGDGPQFPSVVQRTDIIRSRSGWCYGTPGVAAVLWNAGSRLNREDLKGVAIASLHALLDRDRSLWRIDDNAICHGKSGVALCFAAVGRKANDKRLYAFSQTLAREIMDCFDTEAKVGFRYRAPSGANYDTPALLDGAAGTALALLTLVGRCDPSWTDFFGLGLRPQN